MLKYKVRDEVKTTNNHWLVLEYRNRIVEIIQIDKSDNFLPYRIRFSPYIAPSWSSEEDLMPINKYAKEYR